VKTLFYIAAIVVGLIAYFQNNLLYMPTEPIQYPHENEPGYHHPLQQNMNYKDITLRTSDDVNIKGWFIFGNSAKNLTKSAAMKY